MPDIAMCTNEKCPFFNDCYRAQAKPDPYRQSYMNFEPDSRGVCASFWPTVENKSNDETESP